MHIGVTTAVLGMIKKMSNGEVCVNTKIGAVDIRETNMSNFCSQIGAFVEAAFPECLPDLEP